MKFFTGLFLGFVSGLSFGLLLLIIVSCNDDKVIEWERHRAEYYKKKLNELK